MKYPKRYTSLFKHPVVAVFVLALPLFGNSAFAQTLIYDGTTGTGKVTTVSASAHEFEKLPWLSLAGNTQGVLPIVRGNISSYEVDLTIDYSSGAEPQFVMGGYMAGSDYSVESNTVRLQNGAVNGPVYGGVSHTTNLDIGFRPATDTALAWRVLSVESLNNIAERNNVFLSKESSVNGSVYGGAAVLWAQVHDVASFPGNLYGSVAAETIVKDSSALADSNAVTLEEGASMTGDIHGGFANIAVHTSSAVAADNIRLNASDAEGRSTAENVESLAKNNTVILERNSTVQGNVYGGSARSEVVARDVRGGEALSMMEHMPGTVRAEAIAINEASVFSQQNSVALYEGSEVEGNVYGGHSAVKSLAYSAISGTGHVKGVQDWAITVSRAYNIIKADENTVSLKDGSSITGEVYGGSSNLSVISGYAVGADGFVEVAVYGPLVSPGATVPPHLVRTSSVQAVGNTVSLEQGSSVTGNVFGGHVERKMSGSDGPPVISFRDSTLLASENKVVINGKVLGPAIYGGYVKSEITFSKAPSGTVIGAEISGSRAEAVFNTVTIGEHAELAEHTHVFGGFVAVEGLGFEPETMDAVTGNTLEFHASGMRLAGVSNFENYTFHVTENAVEDVPLLSIAATPLQLYASGEHIIDFTHSGSILATLSSINILAAEGGLAEGSDVVLWSVRGAERWGLGSEDFSIGWDDNILSISWIPIPEPGSYIAFVALSVVGITLMRQRRGLEEAGEN